MDTVYSKIIWDELGLDDYKIHKEPWEKTESLILDWVKNNTLDHVNKVLFEELSWIKSVTDEGYYDAPFYGFNQRDKEKRYKKDNGDAEADLMIHDSGIFPSFLHMAIKTGFPPSEFEFLAKVLSAYYEKLPKNESCCSISRPSEGTEL